MFFTSLFCNGQDLDLKFLKDQISANNRAGKQEVSQNKLLKILSQDDLSTLDEANLTLLMASTFRSINDYRSAINYLKKSETLAATIPDEDSLKMNIKAEMAFTYFDDRKYDLSSSIIQKIKSENYKFLDETNHAFIIMQEGFINFLKGNYSISEEQYRSSSILLKKSSPCNLPVIMVKQMQLYAALKNFEKVDEIYKRTIKNADFCSVIKYKIYATEEIKSIYEKEKDQDKVFHFNEKLDSLNTAYNRDDKLAEMHVSNQNFLEKETETEKRISDYYLIIALVLGSLLSVWGIYYFKKNKMHSAERSKFEEEIKILKKNFRNMLKHNFHKRVQKIIF